jgi:uncharacterized membrane protein YeaQ/YmgE (transglycosylase-associated protein family)
MLEIIAIIILSMRIGTIVKEKGRKPGWYYFMTVALWVGGEIVGAFIGAIILAISGVHSTTQQCLTYLFALAGAAAGGVAAYFIAKNLSPVTPPLVVIAGPVDDKSSPLNP